MYTSMTVCVRMSRIPGYTRDRLYLDSCPQAKVWRIHHFPLMYWPQLIFPVSIIFLIFLSFLLFLYFQNVFTDISLSLVVEFVIATFVLHFINFRSRSPLLIEEIRAHFRVVFLGSLLSVIRPFRSTTVGYFLIS